MTNRLVATTGESEVSQRPKVVRAALPRPGASSPQDADSAPPRAMTLDPVATKPATLGHRGHDLNARAEQTPNYYYIAELADPSGVPVVNPFV